MTNNLLTDPRVHALHLNRNPAKTFDIRVMFQGRIYERTGFETHGGAWRWACEQVYGVKTNAMVTA